MEQNPSSKDERPSYIVCKEEVMRAFEVTDTKSLADFYGLLFSSLFNQARDTGRIHGKIDYAPLAPPWLRGNVVFLHGNNRKMSVTFSSKRIPNKNYIRQKRNPLLIHILRDGGISIPCIRREPRTNSNPE